MAKKTRNAERDGEIVMVYYLVYGNRVHAGVDPNEARRFACDAVTLRYGISRGRLMNIISERKCNQDVNRVAFRENTLALIEYLTAMNGMMEKTKDRNDKLLTLLNECIEHGDR